MTVTELTKASQGEQTRARLLACAEELFAEKGFHGVSLSEVASAAGLGNAGLLHHFPSKVSLYRALLEQLAAEAELLLETAAASGKSAKVRWLAVVHSHADWVIRRPDAAVLVLRELIDNGGRVDKAHVLPLATLVHRFEKEIRAAQAAKLVSKGPTLVILTHLLGTLSYGLAVLPTFNKMQPNAAVLKSRERWIRGLAHHFVEIEMKARDES